MSTIVIATGGFDPIHSGHISYLKEARALGDKLVVGVNSDKWLERKKGRHFMDYMERRTIVESIACVDSVLSFEDGDDTACDIIHRVLLSHPNDQIVFANGGDRTADNIPEQDKYKDEPRVTFLFGVGGDMKRNSSSWILNEWKAPKTDRKWGYYRVLHEDTGVKVKELTVEPGESLSMQKHLQRSEYWLVVDGKCRVDNLTETELLTGHSEYHIKPDEWHRLYNPYDKPCKIVEIQYGVRCVEEDIERKK